MPHPATLQGADSKYDIEPDDLDEIRRGDEDADDLDISLDGTDE